ncbi:immunity 49 family protein [Nocardia veterana]|uniref:Immunity 49 family protein n=2 Tax=Nocardia veterana TaxID=132249 RepID=A0A7X6LXB2_9NOCA|nr:immunity 49 family protein [Nocardia veterana]
MDFYLDYIAKDTGALDNVLRRALTLAQYRAAVDPDAAHPATWDALRLASRAATTVFTAATSAEGQEIEAVIGRPVRFTATGPSDSAHAGRWPTALWLAIIVRDDAAIQQLATVPEEILRASGVEHDAYLYPWIETLQAFVTHREVTPEMFLPAMDGTDPDAARFTPPDAMLNLIYPPIEMFYYVLRRDPQKFRAALVQALERHREYWTGTNRSGDPSGFLALAPLAIAVLAQSAGMSVDVQSEYLPANLLTGTNTVRTSG